MTVPLLHDDILGKIRSNPRPIVIEFFAVWCPKCSMMKSIYERVASELSMKADFYRVDIAISEDIVNKLGIEIVPTFVVFFRGDILGYTTGVISQSALKSRIKKLIHF